MKNRMPSEWGLASQRPARLLLHTPARLFGEALGACLHQDDSVEDILVLHDAVGLVGRARGFRANVVLFDVRSGQHLPVVRALTDELPALSVVALTLLPAPQDVIDCVDAGFVGWVARDASLDDLLGVVQMAIRGETTCHPALARSLLDELRRRRDVSALRDGDARLTRRESETLQLMARGMTNKEIALELSLSIATVKNHVHAILQKLQLSRRTEARDLISQKPWLVRSA
jgi:two-component system nitrate/nitrite response regulator NarL